MDADSPLADLLRVALRRTAQTVAIVTAGAHGERYAMSATAVAPVSLDPPSMLFCVNRAAASFSALRKGHGFCVNLLAPEHEELAVHCSGALKGEARFAGGQFADHESGLPYLTTALANIFCTQDTHHLYGTHAVVIGKVTQVRLGEPRPPLLYYDGDYRPMPDDGRKR